MLLYLNGVANNDPFLVVKMTIKMTVTSLDGELKDTTEHANDELGQHACSCCIPKVAACAPVDGHALGLEGHEVPTQWQLSVIP